LPVIFLLPLFSFYFPLLFLSQRTKKIGFSLAAAAMAGTVLGCSVGSFYFPGFQLFYGFIMLSCLLFIFMSCYFTFFTECFTSLHFFSSPYISFVFFLDDCCCSFLLWGQKVLYRIALLVCGEHMTRQPAQSSHFPKTTKTAAKKEINLPPLFLPENNVFFFFFPLACFAFFILPPRYLLLPVL